MTNMVEHMKSRGMDKDMLDRFRIVLDEDERTATIPLWNLSGQWNGYQQYRPDANKEKSNHPKLARYYTHCRKSKEAITLGGLETYQDTPRLFVVEGWFDAVPLWERGIACVFTCGIPDKTLQHWFRVQDKPVITLLDPGIDRGMRKQFKSFSDVMVEPESLGLNCDVGSMSNLDVDRMLNLASDKFWEFYDLKVAVLDSRDL